MKIIQYVASLFMVASLVLVAPASVSAYTTTTMSREAQIAQLQAIIVQLQAQLALLQGQRTTTAVGLSAVVTGYEQVEMRAAAPGRASESVKAWFEYGPTTFMSYSTPLVTTNAGRTVYGVADDITAGQTYYYRVVSENRSGDYYESTQGTFRVTSSWPRSSDRDRDQDRDWDDEYPEVETDSARSITSSSAELRGEVDMNDYEDGAVFFVYGEDEDLIEDATDADEYRAIDEEGDDLQKVTVDSRFDDQDDFTLTVTGLDRDTDHYYTLCVEFENDDDDAELVCGDVESFETDR